MRKRIFLLFLAGVILMGCGTLPKRQMVVNIPPGGVAALNTIPSPRAGLVILINRNEGAQANCFLYEGNRSRQEDIIGIGPDGNPILNYNPLLKFAIGSAVTRDFWSYKALVLQPYTDYTLFIIWTRFTGQVLDFDKIRFKTSGDPFRKPYIDDLGRKIFADNIVRLPRVKTRGVSRLRINKTLYLGDWIKALFGMP